MKIEIKYREKLELRQTSSKPKAEFASQQCRNFYKGN